MKRRRHILYLPTIGSKKKILNCVTGQENGLKRNRVIANLGAIETRFLNVAIKCTREFHQGLFWVHAKKKLDDLGLEIEVRAFIEAALAETVPKPGDDWALWGVKCIPQYDR